LDKQACHPNGMLIDFIDDEHIYRDSTGRFYTSCTELIHQHFPKFETEKIASKYAAKNHLRTEDVIQQWEQNRDEAAELGSRVHAHAERVLKNQPSEPKFTKDQLFFDTVTRFIKRDLLPNYTLLETEKVIFSPKYGLAGTVDLLMKNRSGHIIILDWKTNKQIKQQNRYQRGLGRLSHLPDSNYYHYCLQLNLYRKIMEEEGYYRRLDNAHMSLLHVGVLKVKVYDVPVMKEETQYILNSI
jgi:ATP-dependent exoDNAse (exonuclease V) beta subunit